MKLVKIDHSCVQQAQLTEETLANILPRNENCQQYENLSRKLVGVQPVSQGQIAIV